MTPQVLLPPFLGGFFCLYDYRNSSPSFQPSFMALPRKNRSTAPAKPNPPTGRRPVAVVQATSGLAAFIAVLYYYAL
jgi:hypothetical protein